MLAEGEGFEPPKACTLVVFKTTAIDHSAIPPANTNNTGGQVANTRLRADPLAALPLAISELGPQRERAPAG